MLAECLDGALFHEFWLTNIIFSTPLPASTVIIVVVASRKKLNGLRFHGDPRLQPKAPTKYSCGCVNLNPSTERPKRVAWACESTLFFKDGTREEGRCSGILASVSRITCPPTEQEGSEMV